MLKEFFVAADHRNFAEIHGNSLTCYLVDFICGRKINFPFFRLGNNAFCDRMIRKCLGGSCIAKYFLIGISVCNANFRNS